MKLSCPGDDGAVDALQRQVKGQPGGFTMRLAATDGFPKEQNCDKTAVFVRIIQELMLSSQSNPKGKQSIVWDLPISSTIQSMELSAAAVWKISPGLAENLGRGVSKSSDPKIGNAEETSQTTSKSLSPYLNLISIIYIVIYIHIFINIHIKQYIGILTWVPLR